MKKCDYNGLSEICKDYNDITQALYQLRATSEEEINEIYKDIKRKLIETKILSPSQMCCTISNISFYNNRYFQSYMNLFKKIFEEYHPNQLQNIESFFGYLIYKEYGIDLPINGRYFHFEMQNYSLKSQEENPICAAIMNDDVKSFITFAEDEEFNVYERIESEFYPDSYFSYSWLELCCYHGAVKCFKFMRTRFETEISQECLQLSFLGGNEDIISECLNDFDPDEECMKYAIISHNINFISFLAIEHSIDIDLDYCCDYHNIQAFLVYLDITEKISQCLIKSAKFNFPPICQYLIDHDAYIDARDKDGKTALHHAVENNCVEVVRFFIVNGININEKDIFGKNAFHYVKNNLEILEILISHGIDINEKDNEGKTALHYAAMNDDKTVTEALITHGINVNIGDFHKNTPLHIATNRGSTDVMKILITNGADLNAKNDDGLTALHFEVKRNNIDDMAEFLILQGVNINAKDNKGKTALHYAADGGDAEIIELLLKHGADIIERDIENRTVLHFAAFNYEKEVTKILISHGADINAKDNNGVLPYQIAKEIENTEVLELLMPHNSNFNTNIV